LLSLQPTSNIETWTSANVRQSVRRKSWRVGKGNRTVHLVGLNVVNWLPTIHGMKNIKRCRSLIKFRIRTTLVSVGMACRQIMELFMVSRVGVEVTGLRTKEWKTIKIKLSHFKLKQF
jgi:hypothetical protein